jgi:hypothetical protein
VSAMSSHRFHEAAFAPPNRLETVTNNLNEKSSRGWLSGPRHTFDALGTRHQPSKRGSRHINAEQLLTDLLDLDYSQFLFLPIVAWPAKTSLISAQPAIQRCFSRWDNGFCV